VCRAKQKKDKIKMKKLILLASTIAMACSLQAASFTWGFSSDSIIAPGGKADVDFLEGGTAFLYLGTVSAGESAFDFGTAQLLASAGQDIDYYNFGALDSKNPASSDLLTSTAAGQAYTLILVSKEISSLAGYEGDYILVNGTSGEDTDPMSGNKWATMVDTTAYQGNQWSNMAAVPEPTSGLLLLLGVAGLALRRKQA
jgi:hypothetical protein